jgi:hypothetical protein
MLQPNLQNLAEHNQILVQIIQGADQERRRSLAEIAKFGEKRRGDSTECLAFRTKKHPVNEPMLEAGVTISHKA